MSRVDWGCHEPASQLALAIKCCRSKDSVKIDRTYVTFPAIANMNNARDRPSHFVSKFLTTHRSRDLRAGTTSRTRTNLWYSRPNCSAMRSSSVRERIKGDFLRYNTALVQPITWLFHSTTSFRLCGSGSESRELLIYQAVKPVAMTNKRASKYFNVSS